MDAVMELIKTQRHDANQNPTTPTELAAKLDATIQLTEAHRNSLDEYIIGTQQNLTQIDLAMKRLKSRDSDLYQTMEAILSTMVASRQVLVRANGIINDFVIHLERYESDQN